MTPVPRILRRPERMLALPFVNFQPSEKDEDWIAESLNARHPDSHSSSARFVLRKRSNYRGLMKRDY
jgi:hypothetical protein